MSVRHHAHRAEMNRMKDGPAKRRASQFYNLSHSREHLLALGKMGKKLAKAVVKMQKKAGLMSLGKMSQ